MHHLILFGRYKDGVVYDRAYGGSWVGRIDKDGFFMTEPMAEVKLVKLIVLLEVLIGC